MAKFLFTKGNTFGFKKGQAPWNKGMKYPLGGLNFAKWNAEKHKPWNKGLTKEINERLKNISLLISKRNKKLDLAANLGDWIKKGHISPMKGKVGKKLTKEHIKKSLRRRTMSSLEIKFKNIIDKYKLPYAFVGNGKFFIERKNPDFININGEKKAVEVYCKRHKEYFKGGVEIWKNNRRSIFEKYGWELLFFDAVDLNDELKIKNTLKGEK